MNNFSNINTGGFMILRKTVMILFAVALLAGTVFASGPMEKDRANIADGYKWNLNDLYPTMDAWQQAKTGIGAKIKAIGDYKGKLGKSAADMYRALSYYSDVEKEFVRMYVYASMLSDQDKRESAPLSMEQEMAQIETEFSKTVAFIDPEILAIPQEKIDGFFKSEPKLNVYKQYIGDIQRRKAHTLSEAEERLIAEAGRMSSTAQDVYSIFANADVPRATVTLSTGEEVRLDASGYTATRALPNRDDRILVFNSFFGEMDKFRRTYGAQLYGEVQKNIFYKNARNYESSLERALDRNNIPTSVYHKLIENVNKNLPTLHRYLNLRKRMLGIDELHYYDMYPDLVKDVDLSYTYDEATDVVKKSLAVLGKEYVATLDEAFTNRWIDVYPTPGKRSGAYSQGSAYDVHPYILLNYNGQYEDMSTLAHELGHTMHSFFSNKNQPYPTSNYPIFLAEVASTANEALLMDYMLKDIKDNETRLALLGSYLDNFRTTMFRQTQFAEFELRIHELAESGVALTGDKFNEVYLDILKRYYGHEEGVTVIDDLYAIEWAYIPHFYYNFYVFQYSTSYLASQVLAEKMLTGGPEMVQKYLDFLGSGSSEYAIPTLKKVGIDMTSDEPFTLAMAKMNKVMDEIEKILDEMGR
jgi:oligoendopeptidase F